MDGLMHWSRWGDPDHPAELSPPARGLVEAAFGPLRRVPTVALADVQLPSPALPGPAIAALRAVVGHEHVRTDHESRVRHAAGRSTSDLLRLRSGTVPDAPDAVVTPADHAAVVDLLQVCASRRIGVVPFGGGTSVVGGVDTRRRDDLAGVVALDLRRLEGLVAVDHESRTAVLRAGTRGPHAEALLAGHGLTLGHFPQSFQYATLGGFAATRSSGQASAGYGRFDAMVVGLRAATPRGTWDLGTAPSSAAGPDLRQLMLGSEGALGVITEVTVRVRPQPEVADYEGWRFATFAEGTQALRVVAQSGERPAVLRLSDEAETAINLARPREVGGESSGGCLLILGLEGTEAGVRRQRERLRRALREAGGEALGDSPGSAWAAGRFDGPYLRDSLLDLGVLVETLETAAYWSRLGAVYDAVRAALQADLGADGMPTLVACHVSHVYETGASLYFTVATRQSDDPLGQWARAKAAASDAIVASGGTITHHHAVGADHRPWLTAEIGEVGAGVLRAVKAELDPAGILNPGVLIP